VRVVLFAALLLSTGCFELGPFDFHFCPIITSEGSACDTVKDRTCGGDYCVCEPGQVGTSGTWHCDYPVADLSIPDMSRAHDLGRPIDLAPPTD
jgi:hypothetical protein